MPQHLQKHSVTLNQQAIKTPHAAASARPAAAVATVVVNLRHEKPQCTNHQGTTKA
jgi:hypothetical protein